MVEIDQDQLKALMRMKPTLADTACFFDCSERTIERFIREKFNSSFVEFRNKNMVFTRHSLIRKAISMAEKGNVPMLIFSLKNLCGWSDRADDGGDKGAESQADRLPAMTPDEAKAKLKENLKLVQEKP